jgi:hypothetical protein
VSHVTVWKWRWKARGNEFLGFYTCLCIGKGKDGIYISILFFFSSLKALQAHVLPHCVVRMLNLDALCS